MDHDLLERILQNDSVPTVPAFAMKVVEKCGDPDVSLAEVAALVQNDAATSAKLLKLANSSLFGLSREVSSVHQAVSILGLSTVRMVTIATALVGGLEEKDSGIDHRSFWRGALITSLAAHKLSERVGAACEDQAFVAGLLQNLGIHVMAGALGDRYLEAVRDCSRAPLDQAKVEMEGFGLTHAEVGAQLLQSWNFPKVLVRGVQDHEDEDRPETSDPAGQLAAILHVAEAYRAAFLVPGAAQATALLRRNRELLGLDEEVAVELLTFVEAHASQVAQAFDLDIGSPAQIEEARVQATSELVGLMLRTQAQASENAADGADDEERRSHRAELHGLTVFRAELDDAATMLDDLGEHAFQKILASTSEYLRSTLRQSDLVLRWGATGWVIVVPVGSSEIGRQIGERLCANVRSTPVRTSRGEVQVTLNAGAAWDSTCESEGFHELMMVAEEERILAVEEGGDRVRGNAASAAHREPETPVEI